MNGWAVEGIRRIDLVDENMHATGGAGPAAVRVAHQDSAGGATGMLAHIFHRARVRRGWADLFAHPLCCRRSSRLASVAFGKLLRREALLDVVDLAFACHFEAPVGGFALVLELEMHVRCLARVHAWDRHPRVDVLILNSI